MRKIFLAVLAAVTAVLCLSYGTASASAPDRGRGISCTPAAGSTSCNPTLPNGHQLPVCTVVAPATTCSDHLPGFRPGFRPGLGYGAGGLLGLDNIGLNGLNLLNGNEIVLADGQVVNVCTVPDYSRFDGLYGPRLAPNWRGRLDGPHYVRMVQTVCGTSGTAVVPQQVVGGQNCTTVISNVQQYNGAIGRWNFLAHRDHGLLGGLGLTDRLGLDNAWRDRLHWGQVYGGYSPQVLTTCQAPQPLVIEQAPPLYQPSSAPAPATQAPTAVSPEDSEPAPTQISHVPSGSVSTGDGSAPALN